MPLIVSIELTGPQVANTTAGAQMHEDDFCLTSVATFDRLAERYADKYFHLGLYARYLERFAARIDPGASVIDAACGPGNVSAHLAKLRPDLQLVGVDLAAGMIEQARSRVPGVEFLIADCRRIHELGRVFDACAFAFGLSYLTDEDASRFFISLNAALTDRAMLYLSTVTGARTSSGFEASSSGDAVYLEYRTAADIVGLVERAGYVVEFTDLIASPANAPKPTQDLVLIAQRVC
jgi:SAM-dependent methyltransferase